MVVKKGHTTVKIYKSLNRGSVSFSVVYYLGDKRIRKNFADLALATTEADTVATKLSTGEIKVLEMTGEARLAYIRASTALAPLGFQSKECDFFRSSTPHHNFCHHIPLQGDWEPISTTYDLIQPRRIIVVECFYQCRENWFRQYPDRCYGGLFFWVGGCDPEDGFPLSQSFSLVLGSALLKCPPAQEHQDNKTDGEENKVAAIMHGRSLLQRARVREQVDEASDGRAESPSPFPLPIGWEEGILFSGRFTQGGSRSERDYPGL